MTKQQLYKSCRKIHKWLGLILGIQVFFWISGGLIMSSLPLDKVHGDHLHKKRQESPVNMVDYQVPLHEILQNNKHSPSLVKFYYIDSIPVYELVAKETKIYSGITGQAVSALDIAAIKSRAVSLFTGDESIQSIEKITSIPHEASRLEGPVWKVVFDDRINTTFYMDPYNGKLLIARSDLWRIFDFVWMLHIMDYDTRDDFNNPLLITFAASALLFTLSGIVLLFQVVRRRKYKL